MTAQLILTVTPRGRGRIEGTDLRLTASQNPFLAAARSLIFVGVNPKTVLTLRNAGSSINRVSGSLAVIVRKSGRKASAGRTGAKI